MSSGRLSILMAVWDGASFLPAQLESFENQDFVDWDLLAGDDGSTDDSVAILHEFATRTPAHKVEVIDGPQTGGTAHFLTLLTRAPESARWISFADQDDVWLPDKLSRAVRMLETEPEDTPCLYCGRTWVTGPSLENPVASPAWRRPFGFRNALVQNVASGNTIVLNRAAADLARRAAVPALAVKKLPAHDWWLYQIVTGAGGRILYDTEPSLYYRQHASNQIGANRGLGAALVRARKILGGTYAEWNAANIAALDAVRDDLTEENRAQLDTFARMRQEPFLRRIRTFAGMRLYRQTSLTQTVLWGAVILRQI